jgi:hypothetical protein
MALSDWKSRKDYLTELGCPQVATDKRTPYEVDSHTNSHDSLEFSY